MRLWRLLQRYGLYNLKGNGETMDYPMSFSKRIKQLFCKHEHPSKLLVSEGINSKEGQNLVLYSCMYCDHAYIKWEDSSEWDKKHG